MRRVRVIDATSAGTAVLELDVGNEYSNRGGKTLDSATVMKDCGLIYNISIRKHTRRCRRADTWYTMSSDYFICVAR